MDLAMKIRKLQNSDHNIFPFSYTKRVDVLSREAPLNDDTAR